MHAPAPSATPAASRFRAALPTVLSVTLLVVALRWFVVRWEAVMEGGPRPEISWPWVFVAVVVLLLHSGAALLVWWQVLRGAGTPLSLRVAFDAFAPSVLARYIPGKIWANTVRIALSRRAGLRYGAAAGAMLWETLLGLGTAGLVALATLASTAGAGTVRAAAILLAGTSGAWLVVALMARRPRTAQLIERFGGSRPVRSPSALAPAFATSLVAWALYGTAHLAIARAVAPIGMESWSLVTGAAALAWAGGYLAMMPVGLGVRDGIQLILLASVLTPAQSLLFVALSRVIQLAVDLLITAGWLVSSSVRARGARPTAAPSA